MNGEKEMFGTISTAKHLDDDSIVEFHLKANSNDDTSMIFELFLNGESKYNFVFDIDEVEHIAEAFTVAIEQFRGKKHIATS